ncbi:hypothetical protein [Clostridium grantii]|uniref:Uncharacterized protein n=1 Tax=Clostridium grantii DSM 8605 TaxID=1121316 RepID=A0A1M5QKW9_9CLOT|nr:hypothetical protein [Clostridium grantii]SHH14410.1 hypothetical protein SAMN02745207_00146 [Clostridium grantii DSM 8605]
MLKLSPVEFFFRGIPEGFIFIFAVLLFSNSKIEKNKYVLTSFSYATAVYFIRTLPINFGVNTIISMIVAIGLVVKINNTKVIEIIKSVFITIIVEFFCEWINIFVVENIIGKNLDTVFGNPVSKVIYGAPSLMIFMAINGVFYIVLKEKGKKND